MQERIIKDFPRHDGFVSKQKSMFLQIYFIKSSTVHYVSNMRNVTGFFQKLKRSELLVLSIQNAERSDTFMTTSRDTAIR